MKLYVMEKVTCRGRMRREETHLSLPIAKNNGVEWEYIPTNTERKKKEKKETRMQILKTEIKDSGRKRKGTS